jgi:heat-inducible transcriptional repressor
MSAKGVRTVLNPRRIEILRAIVESFIANAEPVGSKTLVEKYRLPYSSATIRNEMMELETLGYLEKTHTSSGRIPSTTGYRYYVEHLMVEKMDGQLQLALQSVFADRQLKIDEVIKRSCDILAQMTNLTSLVLGPDAQSQTLEHINLFPLDQNQAVAVFITNTGHTENRVFQFHEEITVDELSNCCTILNERLVGTPLTNIVERLHLIKPILAESVKQYEMIFQAFFNAFMKFANSNFYLSGTNNLFNQPEFGDVDKLKQLMSMFENSGIWRELGASNNALRLNHSDHSSLVWMDDMAVVTSTFKLANQEEGKLMVVGPQRMEYDRVVALMEFMSRAIEKVYGYEQGESHE